VRAISRRVRRARANTAIVTNMTIRLP